MGGFGTRILYEYFALIEMETGLELATAYVAAESTNTRTGENGWDRKKAAVPSARVPLISFAFR